MEGDAWVISFSEVQKMLLLGGARKKCLSILKTLRDRHLDVTGERELRKRTKRNWKRNLRHRKATLWHSIQSQHTQSWFSFSDSNVNAVHFAVHSLTAKGVKLALKSHPALYSTFALNFLGNPVTTQVVVTLLLYECEKHPRYNNRQLYFLNKRI